MPKYGEVTVGNPVLAHIKAKRAGVYPFRLHPELWSSRELAEYYADRKWNSYVFADTVPDIPKAPGIYMFVVGPYCGRLKDHSYIFYVGRTKDLRSRFRDYLNEKQGKGSSPREDVVLFLNDFAGYLYFHCTVVPEAELQQAEALLKDHLTPFANTQIELAGKLMV